MVKSFAEPGTHFLAPPEKYNRRNDQSGRQISLPGCETGLSSWLLISPSLLVLIIARE
jgi:hypothetical protein